MHVHSEKLFNKQFIKTITFSNPYEVGKILFLGQIFEKRFLMNLQVLRSPESENHNLNFWSVCACI